MHRIEQKIPLETFSYTVRNVISSSLIDFTNIHYFIINKGDYWINVKYGHITFVIIDGSLFVIDGINIITKKTCISELKSQHELRRCAYFYAYDIITKGYLKGDGRLNERGRQTIKFVRNDD